MRQARWSHAHEGRHRTRHRLRRLGIDVSRDRRRRPDDAAAAHARGALRPGRRASLRLVVAGAATSGRRGRAGGSGRPPRSSAGCSSSSTRAASPGPSSESRPGLTALLVASVPLFSALLDRTIFGVRLSLGALAGIATRAVRRRAPRRPERAYRSRRRGSDPRRRVRVGCGLRVRAGRDAAVGAVPLRRDADALRRGAPRRRRSRDGRGRPGSSLRRLGRLARRLRLPRRLRLDRRLHRVRLAAAERRVERARLDVRVREPGGRGRSSAGSSPARRSAAARSPRAP